MINMQTIQILFRCSKDHNSCSSHMNRQRVLVGKKHEKGSEGLQNHTSISAEYTYAYGLCHLHISAFNMASSIMQILIKVKNGYNYGTVMEREELWAS